MSLKKRYAVVCDECRRASDYFNSPREARSSAKKLGFVRYPKEWLRINGLLATKGVDRCKACAAKRALTGKEAPNAVK